MFPEYHPFKSQNAKEKFFEIYNDMEKQWPVPYQKVMIDTSYGKTYIRISGSKDVLPLVLLHPGGSNSLSWIPQIKELSEYFTIYAIDNIYDNGLSVYTKPVHGLEDYMNWLTEVFDKLELNSSINIMGMSYGAWLSCMYTVKYPEKINKAVLLAPPITVMPVSFNFIMHAMLMMIPHKFFYNRFMGWFFKDYIKKDRKTAENIIDGLYQITKLFKYKRMPDPTLLTDEELEGISVPVLYVVGENEKVYSAHKALERIHKMAPLIMTHMVRGAGHDMLAVEPDFIMEKIMEFLKP
jgi:pimeloyl-ACP methyl ester carboxylesterase